MENPRKSKKMVLAQTNDPRTNPLNFVETAAVSSPPKNRPSGRSQKLARVYENFSAFITKYGENTVSLFLPQTYTSPDAEWRRRLPTALHFGASLRNATRQYQLVPKLIYHEFCHHLYPVAQNSRDESLFVSAWRAKGAARNLAFKFDFNETLKLWDTNAFPRWSEDCYAPEPSLGPWTPSSVTLYERLPKFEHRREMPTQFFGAFVPSPIPELGDLVQVDLLNFDNDNRFYGQPDQFQVVTNKEMTEARQRMRLTGEHHCGVCGLFKRLSRDSRRFRHVFQRFYPWTESGYATGPLDRPTAWSLDHIQRIVNLGVFVYHSRQVPLTLREYCSFYFPEFYAELFESL